MALQRAVAGGTLRHYANFLRAFPDSRWERWIARRIADRGRDDDWDEIVSVRDLCMFEPETRNGYQDADGCPDVDPVTVVAEATVTDTVWMAESALPIDAAVALAVDPDDAGLLYLAAVNGDVFRFRPLSGQAIRLGRVAELVTQLLAGRGWLAARTADGSIWLRVADGGFWLAEVEAGSRLEVLDAGLCDGPPPRLALATTAGVYVYHEGSFRRFGEAERFRMIECDGTKVYALRERGGVVVFDATRIADPELFLPADIFGDRYPTSIAAMAEWFYFVEREGGVWRATPSTGIEAFGTGLPAGVRGQRLVALRGDPPSLYLVSADGRLFVLAPDHSSWLPAPAGVEGLSVRTLGRGHGGRAYLLGVAGRSMVLSEARVEERRTLEAALLFDFGSATPRQEAMAVTAELAARQKAWPGARIRVERHTDNFGSDYRNMALSYERAGAIAALFQAHGVPAWALWVAGYGETRPVATNRTAAGRARNRRVEVLFVSFDLAAAEHRGYRVTDSVGVAPGICDPATQEVLNGLDDNCDGQIDEGWVGSGALQITLGWSSPADLDLYVIEPDGNAISYRNSTSPSGGRLDRDSNAGCRERQWQPTENVFWPSDAPIPSGDYRVRVHACHGWGTHGPQDPSSTAIVTARHVTPRNL